MKRVTCFLLVSLVYNLASAQQILPEFGKIDIAELQMKSCPFEPDAVAMNLFDVQETELTIINQYISRLTTERRVRIKIFNESGYKYASIQIPYFSKKGVTKIKDLSGVVYNLDSSGNIVVKKLEKKDFFKEKAEENLGVINFAFPNVKPGSVIEFRYTKTEKNIWNIDPWIAQDVIPTAYASTTIITPGYLRIKEKIYGSDTIIQKKEQLTKGASPRDKKIFFKENIKSFRAEPFMSSFKDNLLRAVFLLVPVGNFLIEASMSPRVVWTETGFRFFESPNYGEQIKKIIPGTEGLIDSARKMPSIGSTVDFIYKEVKKRAPVKVEQTLSADDITDAWNNKTGNSTEINLILLNLLEKANVKCYPLLVSTRENGKVNTAFPSAGQLNGLDVLVVDFNNFYVLDASLKYQSFRNPPPNIMNREAFLLIPGDMKWVMITDERPLLKQNTTIIATVEENGVAEGNATNLYFDYARSSVLDSAKEENEDRFFDKQTPGLKIISVDQKNTDNDTDPLLQQIKFSYELQNSGDFYFINPQFLFLKRENPFTKETRNTDIDFGSNQQINITFQLNIPDAYKIEKLPGNILVRAPDTSFFFKRIVSSDSSYILLSQTFEIKRSFFEKENYSPIREFFAKAYALMQEEIVLKKKK